MDEIILGLLICVFVIYPVYWKVKDWLDGRGK